VDPIMEQNCKIFRLDYPSPNKDQSENIMSSWISSLDEQRPVKYTQVLVSDV
jgi:hypothetical protein